MWVLLSAVFVASLLGSLHCVGMCGPFAMLASANPDQRQTAIVPAVAYSGGRLVTYALVGLLFGVLGLAINQGAAAVGGWEFAEIQQTATMLAGLLMVIVGVVAMVRLFGFKVPLPSFAAPVQRWLSGWFQVVKQQPPKRKAFLIGALSCLMPCGWLYTFAIVAAGTGSPLWGTLVMVSFWAGTVPILSALILGAGKLTNSLGRRVPYVMAGLVIAIGIFTMVYRAPVDLSDQSVQAAGQGRQSSVMGKMNNRERYRGCSAIGRPGPRR